MLKAISRATLWAWLGCAASTAWAAQDDIAVICAVPELSDHPGATALADAVRQLMTGLTRCQTHAPWLAQLGHLLNRQARYAEAADHLERALMLAPQLQAAQLDYAIALAGQGDTATALALINELLADEDLPAHLRPILQRQVERWRSPLAQLGGWQTGGAVSARLGWDSNLLGSPNLSTLTLTLPGQPIVLPLDEAYRPLAGAYFRTDVQLGWRKIGTTGAQWQINAALRHRSSGYWLPQGTSSQYDFQAERTSFALAGYPSALYIGAGLSGLDAQAGTRYQALSWTAGYERSLAGGALSGDCQMRGGFELQDRRYSSNPLLSGLYHGLAGAWSCLNPLGSSWHVALKTGRDTAASADRAGGDQAQTNLRLVGQWPVQSVWGANNAQLMADLDLGLAQDSDAYSPLLERGAPRTMRRQAARIEYRQSMRPSLQWATGAEWTVQRSNLPLFDTHSWGPYATLRWLW